MKLNRETTKRAIARNLKSATKCRVSFAGRFESQFCFEVACPSGHTHAVQIERDLSDTLHGFCEIPETGEACPAELGHRVCWHIAAALSLYVALEAGYGRKAQAEAFDADGATEIAVLLDAPLPATVSRRAWREAVERFLSGGTPIPRAAWGL